MSTASADNFQVWDVLSGAYVDLKTSIVGNAPAGLDTMQGIAASINNDPVFSMTVDTANDALANDITSKAPKNNPTFTGTVAGITKAMAGLGSVDNTTDLLKPVSTATNTELLKKDGCWVHEGNGGPSQRGQHNRSPEASFERHKH